ncbi:MAG: HAMP domain-containing histidine kinase [Vicinamibacteria bacterium]|jgi:signal transduction histidine kinase|nr:HAMP domain-containing histidine kinase [Vicinamibacteria bacterium]
MSETRRLSYRFVMGLAFLAAILIEIQMIVSIASTRARLKEQRTDFVRDAVARVDAGLLARLGAAEPAAVAEAPGELARALSSRGGEVEIFAARGQRLSAYPQRAPIEHWPAADEMRELQSKSWLTIGPWPGAPPRILTYLRLSAREPGVIVRVAMPAPESSDDLRQDRDILIGQAAVLILLIIIAALMLLSFREAQGSQGATESRAFAVYEAAMSQLKEHGSEQAQRHQAERRRLEDLMRDKEAMARAGELTAGMVHELRNGLGTVLANARLIEGERQASPATVEAAGAIRGECAHLESVIRRFMDFISSETLQYAEFDLARLLTRVVARECHAHAGADTRIAGAEACRVNGDEALLERAFENLIRNAREAAGSHGHVRVAASRTDDHDAIVTIEDDGPGLPEDLRAEIKPFRTTKPQGLGLGLAIAYKMIQLHQGRLSFHDCSPHGLKVVVRLPRAGSENVT